MSYTRLHLSDTETPCEPPAHRVPAFQTVHWGLRFLCGVRQYEGWYERGHLGPQGARLSPPHPIPDHGRRGRCRLV